MTNDALKLEYLLSWLLYLDSPVLSGNMQKGIKIVNVSGDELTIEIDAPFYDFNKWKKTGNIIHTGKSYGGITDYAMWVNNSGAFGKKNKSMHWVNRACYNAANQIANEIGATVINELPID